MSTIVSNQLIQQIVSGTVRNLVNGFLVERQSRGLSKKTIQFYKDELRRFSEYLDKVGVINLEEVTAHEIRKYLLELGETRNQGGIHSSYRAIKAWINWVWDEFEIDQRNPIKKVKIQAGNNQPLPGIKIEDVRLMLDTCKTGFALRDKSILMTLVDTGVRAGELISLNIGDVDYINGAVQIRHGKGDKSRIAYLGKKSRKMIRRYLKHRTDYLKADSPLFVTKGDTRLSFSGLREIVRRRAQAAGIREPGLHDFRRCFAVQMLRNGCDLVTLSRLMGHSTLSVTQRYLYLVDDDLREGHQIAGPVDNAGL